METIIIIKLVFISIGIFYAGGLCMVFYYDYKLRRAFELSQSSVEFLEKLGLSMALLHVRIYKIKKDYTNYRDDLERKRRFVLKNLLLVKRSSLKIEKKIDLC